MIPFLRLSQAVLSKTLLQLKKIFTQIKSSFRHLYRWQTKFLKSLVYQSKLLTILSPAPNCKDCFTSRFKYSSALSQLVVRIINKHQRQICEVGVKLGISKHKPFIVAYAEMDYLTFITLAKLINESFFLKFSFQNLQFSLFRINLLLCISMSKANHFLGYVCCKKSSSWLKKVICHHGSSYTGTTRNLKNLFRLMHLSMESGSGS